MSSINDEDKSDHSDKITEILEIDNQISKNRESSLMYIKPIEIFGKMERMHRKKRKKSTLFLNEQEDKSEIFK